MSAAASRTRQGACVSARTRYIQCRHALGSIACLVEETHSICPEHFNGVLLEQLPRAELGCGGEMGESRPSQLSHGNCASPGRISVSIGVK